MPDQYTDDEVEAFKRDWRASHPATVKFWRQINLSAVLAVENQGRLVRCGRIDLECDGDFLRIRLPSGRCLSYPRPSLIDGRYGKCISFYNNSAGQFKPCRNGQGAYGGLWTENTVQAIARDALAEALLRVEPHFRVIAHVHDEILCEVPERACDLKTFHRLLTTHPKWSLDLPIAASVWCGPRYVKR